jgi:hypothetical protein
MALVCEREMKEMVERGQSSGERGSGEGKGRS